MISLADRFFHFSSELSCTADANENFHEFIFQCFDVKCQPFNQKEVKNDRQHGKNDNPRTLHVKISLPKYG